VQEEVLGVVHRRSIDDQREREAGLLLEAARLYYELGLTQVQVAKRMRTSASTVSRLLRTARDTGVVKITLDYGGARSISLEQQLRDAFGLKEAFVLQNPGYGTDEMLEGIGRLTATYLEALVRDDMVLGMSYGHSIAATIRNMRPRSTLDMTVVQIIGALGSSNPRIEGSDLTREFARAMGAQYRYLYAPLMVESRRARDIILQEPLVQEAMELARRADAVLIGIGTPSSVNFWSGYLSKYDLSKVQARGAVGHMCAEFFDVAGNIIKTQYTDRTIGIRLDELKNVGSVIAVAGGAEKAGAIRGALRGGYVDVLICEETAARDVLELGGS